MNCENYAEKLNHFHKLLLDGGFVKEIKPASNDRPRQPLVDVDGKISEQIVQDRGL